MFTITYNGKYIDYIDNFFLPYVGIKTYGTFISSGCGDKGEEDLYLYKDKSILVFNHVKTINKYLYDIPVKIYKREPLKQLEKLKKWLNGEIKIVKLK